MCLKPKIQSVSDVREQEKDNEVIKDAVQADASTQKATAQNRTGSNGHISENIRTSNNGIEEEVKTSKKKLLGE